MDVLIAGAGPAGQALAAACARAGLRTALIDPAPARPWRATYGAWRDEVPGLPPSAIAAAPPETVAVAKTEHRLRRDYVVLDNGGLRNWLTEPAVELITGEVAARVTGPRGTTVRLRDGRRLACALAVDATGARQVLSGRTLRPAEQTAFGLVLPAELATRVTGRPESTAVFMDWRQAPDPAGSAEATFLYAIPLGGGETLVEETSLARSPGMPPGILAARLRSRLADIGALTEFRRENVRIPLDLPIPARDRLGFGVAGGSVHPATGYSLATSLRLAPQVAAAIAATLPAGPRAAAQAARQANFSPAARKVHALRRFGLRALMNLRAEQQAEFFELFFGLPEHLQVAYLSGRENPRETLAAMVNIFQLAPWPVRRVLMGQPVRH